MFFDSLYKSELLSLFNVVLAKDSPNEHRFKAGFHSKQKFREVFMEKIIEFIITHVIEILAIVISFVSLLYTRWNAKQQKKNEVKIERQVISNSDLRKLYKFNNDQGEVDKIFNDVSRIMYYSGKVYRTELYYEHKFILKDGKALYVRLINMEQLNRTVSKFIEEAKDEAKNAKINILDKTIEKNIDYYIKSIEKIEFRNIVQIKTISSEVFFGNYSNVKNNIQFDQLGIEKKEFELTLDNRLGIPDSKKLFCYGLINDNEFENQLMYNMLNQFIEANFFYVN